jgi:16S rRNA (cytidine1402-2'-O)-methyltransferase
MSAKLSVVATPIGNLEDITLRALRVLKEADVIVCEDTRITRKLLAHFDIHTPTSSLLHVVQLLLQGKRVALVSDAGTPGISDPGLAIVSRVRELGITIEAIPGPSALAAAVSIAGVKAPSFTFYGFLPLKKGREKLLAQAAADERASVMYESPHRILKLLTSLSLHLKTGRKVVVLRELTKVHEEVLIGTPQEVSDILMNDPQKTRGEFVVLLEAL